MADEDAAWGGGVTCERTGSGETAGSGALVAVLDGVEVDGTSGGGLERAVADAGMSAGAVVGGASSDFAAAAG